MERASRRSLRHVSGFVAPLIVVFLGMPAVALAVNDQASTLQRPTPNNSAPAPKKKAEKPKSLTEKVVDVGSSAVKAVVDAPGAVVGAVAGGVLDQATKWMADGAAWVTDQVLRGMRSTSTPELSAGWFASRFSSMAGLGMGFSALVMMIALGSAALRRDPEALAGTITGVFRAAFGTGLVLALTVMALGLADAISDGAAAWGGKGGHAYWVQVADVWKKSLFLGVASNTVGASSAVWFLFAVLHVIAALAVWVELLFRQAAIYVAVLFMPVVLAAGIWPRLRVWQSRLTRALFCFVAMKPVVIITLSLAGSAVAAGLGGNAERPIAVVLAAFVIFCLAVWAPFALMHLIGTEVQAAQGGRLAAGGAMRSGAGRVGSGLAAGRSLGGGAGLAARGGGVSSSGPAGRGVGSSIRAGRGGANAGGAGAGRMGGAAGVGAVGAVATAAGLTGQASRSVGQRAGGHASLGAHQGGQTSSPSRSSGAPQKGGSVGMGAGAGEGRKASVGSSGVSSVGGSSGSGVVGRPVAPASSPVRQNKPPTKRS